MLSEAKRASVHAILLTDHHRPPKDFITDSWRGIREGVLFVPGSESRGFLIYPTKSIMGRMSDPTSAFIQAVRDDNGLIFLSHIEERPDHPMTDLDGLEIYNRHADLKKDKEGVATLILRLTDPASLAELEEDLRLYPDEILAAQQTYQADYLAKWDAETKSRRLTGVAANDCHHYMVLLVTMVDADHVRVGTNVDPEKDRRTIDATLRPGIKAMTKGHQPGDVLARIDLDPYSRSFRNASTHILASELSEAAIRQALRAGHAYVSHDWICDPTGFRFEAMSGPDNSSSALMGDDVTISPSLRLVAHFPVSCRIRLLRDGRVIEDHQGDNFDVAIKANGVYRVEGWITLDDEERPWIYSNPIYVHAAK
ncbi:histidinol phosphatase [Singulisphaera sp. Ch08]|uniref:Histidinol phosphatase n=1 Tax=Singulisphaera sp. Ch08 TaxID=3120278 RepID=A0AAU7CIV4_9BACT